MRLVLTNYKAGLGRDMHIGIMTRVLCVVIMVVNVASILMSCQRLHLVHDGDACTEAVESLGQIFVTTINGVHIA